MNMTRGTCTVDHDCTAKAYKHSSPKKRRIMIALSRPYSALRRAPKTLMADTQRASPSMKWRRAPFSNSCDARRPLPECLRMLAHRVFFFASKHARAGVARARGVISPHVLGKTAFFHFDSDGKLAKCKAPTCCCQLASACRPRHVAFWSSFCNISSACARSSSWLT